LSLERVTNFLSEKGFADRIKVFDVSSATVELAAKAIGCEPQEIAKTMAFYMNDSCVMIVTAGDTKIDNQKFKAEFSCKAKMLKFEDVEKLTSHPAGGVCPFAVNENAKVYLDNSLKRFSIIYPAAGTANSAVKLTPEELFQITGAEWVDVTKIRE
jgi:prolyl-tRNA editing enzyme YbaK/EbsC (Cys-tRNA(Pro) deacylase)